MAKIKLEYIWLDGYTPVANLRGKTKIVDGDVDNFSLADCPEWGFDGSSTEQADGSDSDCMLKPVALFPDITRKNAFLVMTEVMLPNGDPHPSNARATIPMTKVSGSVLNKNTFLQDDRPLGWPKLASLILRVNTTLVLVIKMLATLLVKSLKSILILSRCWHQSRRHQC